jgi:quercetin dioxygenase-like cupin family protein
MHLPAGGIVGEHEAMSGQLFCVVSGEGWVSGDDGERRAIKTHEAACWSRGERHAAGTETGLTAIVIEGDFTVAAPTGD